MSAKIKTWQERQFEHFSVEVFSLEDDEKFMADEIADLRAALQAQQGEVKAPAHHCRDDGRCQQAIEYMVDDIAFCSPKCVQPRTAPAPATLSDARRRMFAAYSVCLTDGHKMMPLEIADALLAAAGSSQAQDANDAARYRALRNQNIFAQVGSFTPYVVQGQTMRVLEGMELDKEVDALAAKEAGK